MPHLGRREFIGLIGGAAAWPVSGYGQSSRKRLIVNLATASFASATPQSRALLRGFQELGHVEGRDFDMVRLSAEGVVGRLPALAKEAVRLKPDVMVANPTPAVVAVSRLTETIPIVSFMLADEERLGLVASSARPGRNVTGLLMRVDGMAEKQIQLATDLVPGTRRLAILYNPHSPDAANQRREAERASTVLGTSHTYIEIPGPGDIQPAFQRTKGVQAQVVVVLYDALFFQERQRLAELAALHRLPAVYAARDHAAAGGLISYGVSLAANAHRAASYVDRIFKGAAPAELPLEFPTKLELVINLKTANALGLDVPPTLLARADEVIE
jgi:putative tryptophan/tyrosine transport system substrate-binding protein